MLNKKMLLSILTIFFIGAAAAGTWAQMSVNADGNLNEVEAAAFPSFEMTAKIDSTDVLETTPITMPTVVPGQSATIETVTIKNKGNVPGILTATVDTTGSESPLTSWMQLYVPGVAYLFDKGTAGVSSSITLGTLDAMGGAHDSITLPIVYNFVDTGVNGANQIGASGQTFNYKITYKLTATQV